ncbi:hypothetical protein BZL39_D06245 [Zygosaccharomyces parabailii]|nr:hypothetical protein BZL39_D06245 [Zygosaccharomyces parabailii]
MYDKYIHDIPPNPPSYEEATGRRKPPLMQPRPSARLLPNIDEPDEATDKKTYERRVSGILEKKSGTNV